MGKIVFEAVVILHPHPEKTHSESSQQAMRMIQTENPEYDEFRWIPHLEVFPDGSGRLHIVVEDPGIVTLGTLSVFLTIVAAVVLLAYL